jgi:hypothetical protein
LLSRDEARRIVANIAKVVAEAVISSVELIVQPGAKADPLADKMKAAPEKMAMARLLIGIPCRWPRGKQLPARFSEQICNADD